MTQHIQQKTFIPVLVGSKYDLFEEIEDHHKDDITRQARKFAKKMRAPLIYCSCAQMINVDEVFKVIMENEFIFKSKVKEKTLHRKEAIIELKQKSKDKQEETGSNEKRKKKEKHKSKKQKSKKKKSKKKKGDDNHGL